MKHTSNDIGVSLCNLTVDFKIAVSS